MSNNNSNARNDLQSIKNANQQAQQQGMPTSGASNNQGVKQANAQSGNPGATSSMGNMSESATKDMQAVKNANQKSNQNKGQ